MHTHEGTLLRLVPLFLIHVFVITLAEMFAEEEGGWLLFESGDWLEDLELKFGIGLPMNQD